MWKSRMGERPIEFPGLRVERPYWNRASVDLRYRCDFGVITGREYFIGSFKIAVLESVLDDCDAAPAQEADNALTCDARKKRSIHNWSKNNVIFCHKDIGGRKLGDIAKHVQHNGVVEAPCMNVEQRASVVGI